MKKLNMKTKNVLADKIRQIEELFPNVIVDDGAEKKIDFDLLKQELKDNTEEGQKERYQLTWSGKKNAKVFAYTPTTNTLRPEVEKSVDFENTKNIYIEGENLEVLKILQESYLGKIGIIYIDPPYNTGNDYIYKDRLYNTKNEELVESGQMDENSYKLVSNSKSNGKYHSLWLSMMYSRLILSRNLLDSTGIIYINIDDNEVYSLKTVCDEIFGMNNIIACCTRISKRTSNKGNYFKPTKDYILIYAKNIENITWKFGIDNKVKESEFIYEDERGKYKKNGASLYQPSLDSRTNQRYYIECPDGSLIIPPGNVFPKEKTDGAKVKPESNDDKCWRWSLDTYLKNKDKLMFTKASKNCPLIDSEGKPSKWNIYDKVYLDYKIDETLLPEDIIYDYVNSQGTKEVLALNMDFSFAKPVGLIKYLIKLTKLNSNIKVLDFFSGSATTAQAVMELNAEDNGNRQYILVQFPEEAEGEYKNICELGEERIRRAGKKIKEETGADVDYGFRVYKVDSSNMKDVYYSPSDINQAQLDLLETNIKQDRKEEDLLTQVILDLGLTLDLKIEQKKILKNNVYFVDKKSLVACFDDEIDINILDEMCKCKPRKIVFKESSFKTDKNKINIFEKIKKLSSNTQINII